MFVLPLSLGLTTHSINDGRYLAEGLDCKPSSPCKETRKSEASPQRANASIIGRLACIVLGHRISTLRNCKRFSAPAPAPEPAGQYKPISESLGKYQFVMPQGTDDGWTVVGGGGRAVSKASRRAPSAASHALESCQAMDQCARATETLPGWEGTPAATTSDRYRRFS